MNTLTDTAARILSTFEPSEKVRLSQQAVSDWRHGHLSEIGSMPMPFKPPNPPRPQLLPPGKMPKRGKGSIEGRFAFVHAIAHIEFAAINLAWDIVGRFVNEGLPVAFYDDWICVADDETRHFAMLSRRLQELGGSYGDVPAHAGLWDAARKTSGDILSRLAIIPMALEARGLDTTPKAVQDLRKSGDDHTADIMETIGKEEIPHVQAGVRWFEFICQNRNLNPHSTFRHIISDQFNGALKPPFNHQARALAGMAPSYYDWS